ncbi:ATP-binding protein [Marinospirillum sp.]|uniref:ATP-binding protein n=1 Tax=Marinospirillum sp. TaxID=2183934 RepID=UPI0038506B48
MQKFKAFLHERVQSGGFSRLLIPLLLTCWLLVGLLLLHSYQSSVSNYSQAAYKRSEQHTSALLDLQKSLVTAKLQEMQRVLEAISSLMTSPEMNREQLLLAMQARKQPSPEILVLMLLDAKGQAKAFSLPGEKPELADRDYFTWHRDNPDSDQLFLSKPLLSRNAQRTPFVALSKALTDDQGEFQGVLAMGIDLEALAHDLRGLVSKGGHATVLAHQEGEIYFRMPWIEGSSTGGSSPIIAQHQGALEDHHLTRITSPFDDKSRQVAYGKVGNWPLVAFISENLEGIEASIQAYQTEQASRWGLAFLLASLLFAGLALLIHQRQKTLLQLSEKEERYRLAKDAANIGIWDMEVKTGRLSWDLQTWQQLGYSRPAFTLNYQTWLDTIHPEDLPQVLAITSEKIQSSEPFEIEYRSRTAQGHWQWQQGRGRTVSWDDQGHPLRVMGTSQTIQAKKDSEEKLQEQAAALQASNEELEQFAYVASHDLRQPLRMISSYVELMKRRLAGHLDDETQVFMNFIAEGSARMDSMLVSLLEYSRVGRHGEPIASLDSRSLVKEALTYLQPQIKEAQAKIDITGDWPQELQASRNEIVRLFQNLINNALKYQPPGQQPQITLTAEDSGEHWLFKVKDNGIGVDPGQQDRLFKVFQRLHTRQEYEGTGIGLAICRKIVERHKGEIWLHSAGKGQGCCFCFTLAKEPL